MAVYPFNTLPVKSHPSFSAAAAMPGPIEALAEVALGVDLDLTDAHMPNLDGFDLTRRAREASGH